MNAPDWLPGVVLCIGILMISINFWYIVYVPQKYKKEGFDSNEKVSDTDAAHAYRTLLTYMKGNTQKTLKIIADFTNRVYGSSLPVLDSFDPRQIMDNFVNPITGM